jgi:hypothetical protein
MLSLFLLECPLQLHCALVKHAPFAAAATTAMAAIPRRPLTAAGSWQQKHWMREQHMLLMFALWVGLRP